MHTAGLGPGGFPLDPRGIRLFQKIESYPLNHSAIARLWIGALNVVQPLNTSELGRLLNRTCKRLSSTTEFVKKMPFTAVPVPDVRHVVCLSQSITEITWSRFGSPDHSPDAAHRVASASGTEEDINSKISTASWAPASEVVSSEHFNAFFEVCQETVG